MIWTRNYYETLKAATIIIQRNVKRWYGKKAIIDMFKVYYEEVQMPEKIKIEQDYIFNVYKRQEQVGT